MFRVKRSKKLDPTNTEDGVTTILRNVFVIYMSKQRDISENVNLQLHCREDFKNNT